MEESAADQEGGLEALEASEMETDELGDGAIGKLDGDTITKR